MAGCFDYYAGLAEELDGRQDSPIDVSSSRQTGCTSEPCSGSSACRQAHVLVPAQLQLPRGLTARQSDRRAAACCQVGMEEFAVRVRREPLGVVALITPWNYPLLMATVRRGALTLLATWAAALLVWASSLRAHATGCTAPAHAITRCSPLIALSCRPSLRLL